MSNDTRQVMARPQIELSEETKKRLEEITLAAFHNLIINTVSQLNDQMCSNALNLASVQQAAIARVVSDIMEIKAL